jgi:hypothetical protein
MGCVWAAVVTRIVAGPLRAVTRSPACVSRAGRGPAFVRIRCGPCVRPRDLSWALAPSAATATFVGAAASDRFVEEACVSVAAKTPTAPRTCQPVCPIVSCARPVAKTPNAGVRVRIVIPRRAGVSLALEAARRFAPTPRALCARPKGRCAVRASSARPPTPVCAGVGAPCVSPKSARAVARIATATASAADRRRASCVAEPPGSVCRGAARCRAATVARVQPRAAIRRGGSAFARRRAAPRTRCARAARFDAAIRRRAAASSASETGIVHPRLCVTPRAARASSAARIGRAGAARSTRAVHACPMARVGALTRSIVAVRIRDARAT